MGLGNGNPKSGNKGSNYAYELKTVRALQELIKSVSSLNPGGGGTGVPLATESTLLSVLAAIIASDQDIEILLVRDTVTLEVFQQITDYTSGVPTVIYKDVNGVIIPQPLPNPIEYLDPSAVMNLMLTELLTLNAGGPLATETTLGTVNTNLGSINTNIQLSNVELVNILTALNGSATEATQLLVESNTETLAKPILELGMTLGTFTNMAGNIPTGKRSISILNSGGVPASIGGVSNNLPAGVEVTWEAGGLRDTLGVLTWDATGTTLIISTVG